MNDMLDGGLGSKGRRLIAGRHIRESFEVSKQPERSFRILEWGYSRLRRGRLWIVGLWEIRIICGKL